MTAGHRLYQDKPDGVLHAIRVFIGMGDKDR